MKKFTLTLFSILLVFCGVFFAACEKENKNGKIYASKNNITIELGKSENNSESFYITQEGVDVDRLVFSYDSTDILVNQEKISNSDFLITVKSISEISIDSIEVKVFAGKYAKTSFYVTVTLPVESITAKENIYIPYNNQESSINLLSYLNFYPDETKQKDVQFKIVDKINLPEEDKYQNIKDYVIDDEKAWIVGKNLFINKTAKSDFNFNTNKYFVVVEAESLNSENIKTLMIVEVMPNPELLMENFSVYINDVMVTEKVKKQSLNLNKDSNYNLTQDFVVKVEVPSMFNIDVDIAKFVGTDNSKNILNVLSYTKQTQVVGAKDVITFTFESYSANQCIENVLKFNYSYKDMQEDNLEFEALDKNNSELLIDVVLPIESITVKTDAVKEAGKYIVYTNYASGTLGTEFSFIANPTQTIQNNFVLVVENNTELSFKNINGEEIELIKLANSEIATDYASIYGEDPTEEQYYIEFKSADRLFIKAKEVNDDITVKVFCKGTNKKSELTLIKSEISSESISFVDSAFASKPDVPVTAKTINLALGDESEVSTEAFIYAKDASLSHFKYDNGINIEDINNGYFKILINESAVGVKNYTISTVNGFELYLTVNVVKKITTAEIALEESQGEIAGVKNFDDETEGIYKISIQKGYSVPFEYLINEGAEILKINYSYFNDDTTDFYSFEFNNTFANLTYGSSTKIVGINKVDDKNILVASECGFVYLKAEIFGQDVKNNKLIISENPSATIFILVEVYNPVKYIALDKEITLRAEDQVNEDNKNACMVTLNYDVLSSGSSKASYNYLYMDLKDGFKVTSDQFNTTLDVFDLVNKKLKRTITDKYSDPILEVIIDYNTKTITVTCFKYVESIKNIKFYAIDEKYIIESDYMSISDYLSDVGVNVVSFELNLNIIETKAVEEVFVENLTENNNEDNSDYKFYETLYFDKRNYEEISFKLETSVSPSDAFDKTVTYSYQAGQGSDGMLVAITEDGVVSIQSDKGGKGFIYITANHPSTIKTPKTVIVPFVILDGESYQTAYNIQSLGEIKDLSKHYVLGLNTYVANDVLLEGEFTGGLYGCKFDEQTSDFATIHLNNTSLFETLSGTVKNLYVTGTATNSGFIANVNNGTIDNVHITAYINDEGKYIPSCVYINNEVNVESAGVFAFSGNGTINNCSFNGSVNSSKDIFYFMFWTSGCVAM